MQKLKVMTLIGTRPEIIKLSRVIAKLDEHTDHTLVHSGQNYDFELNQVFFNDLNIREPDYFLDAAGDSVADTISNVISKIDNLIEEVNPQAFLVLGDTNSCLAVIAVKRRKIPIFHMEAGNRCFDQRVPEEINRKLVDHLSDINMPYSDIARSYLINEGIPADRIIKTGSPMYEVLEAKKEKINNSKILEKLDLKQQDYFVVSCHREENVDSDNNLNKLVNLLNTLVDKYKKKIIFTTHPRTRKRLDEIKQKLNKNIEFIKPLGFTDYIHLQQNAITVLSDSGTITEESSILNFPAINIRESHERPEGMEEGAVMMTGLEFERIEQALSILAGQKRDQNRNLNIVNNYDVANVSEKVVRIILSYTDYVNRYVWRKQI